jgi:hypothetical protein
MILSAIIFLVLFYEWHQIMLDCVSKNCPYAMMFLQENLDDLIFSILIFLASLLAFLISKKLYQQEKQHESQILKYRRK